MYYGNFKVRFLDYVIIRRKKREATRVPGNDTEWQTSIRGKWKYLLTQSFVSDENKFFYNIYASHV